jgi:hypothetical protein|tara:strand:- start:4778 stop:5140 length:363 start_codon:yes stop_codon:yes gene_type:complete
MNNRLKLDEQEKNRIKDLHSVRLFREQWEKVDVDEQVVGYGEQGLNEDGHTDVSSAKRKLKLSIENAQETLSLLETMESEDDLPSWWMSKITLAEDYLSKCRDYIANPDEEYVRLKDRTK